MGSLAPAVVAAMESVLGAPIAEARSVAGGDINQAWAITTGAGDRLFAKTNPRAAAGMFAAEAKGLTWLAEAGCLRVPRVLGQGDGEGARFLLLEMITSSARRRDHDELFGRGLAALHRFGAAGFGLDHDNFIGDVPQKNQPVAAEVTWAGFYRSHRLQPMLARADKRGLVNVGLRRRFDELFDRLPELAGPEEPPARLHGDLWGGNAITDEEGAPVIIDPAVYGGHREMDLAMMRLFGGFGPRVFAAYDEAYPLADGWEERVPLCQLYPLLVHVVLFGGGYVGSVAAAVDRIL